MNSIQLISGNNYTNSGHLVLYNSTMSGDLAGGFNLCAAVDGNDSHVIRLTGRTDGALIWNNIDLGNAAIVSKLFNVNAYIKYACGLILQWGQIYNSPSPIQLTFLIAFPNTYSIALTPDGGPVNTAGYASTQNAQLTGPTVNLSRNDYGFRWIAIGY